MDFRAGWAPQFDYLEKLAKQLADLAAPSAALAQQLQQIARVPDIPEPTGYRALQEMQAGWASEHRRMNESLTAAFSGILGEFNVLRVVIPDSRYQNSVGSQLARSLDAIRLPQFPVIESLQRELRLASLGAESLYEFQRTFAGQLLTAVAAVAEAPDVERERRTARVLKLLRGALSRAKALVAREGLLSLALAVYLHLLSQANSRESEGRILSEVGSLRAELAEKLVKPSPDLRVVVANLLNVRFAPSGKAKPIGRLTANTLVRVLEKQADWARVEYFDFVSAEVREGWVSVRFLRELPDALAK